MHRFRVRQFTSWIVVAMTTVVVICLLTTPLRAQSNPTRDRIRDHLERLRFEGELIVGGAPIAAVVLLPGVYERNDFEPLWTGTRNIDELVEAIRDSWNEGLDPEDYHLRQIEELRGFVGEHSTVPALAADLDIVLTESLIRLAYHLSFGKVDPEDLDSNWNLTRKIRNQDPIQVIREAIDSPSLGAFIDSALPERPVYEGLKEALARYREIDAAGGWNRVPDGPVLKPGKTDDRVPALRARLQASGDLADDASLDSTRYDDTLREAVERFQIRHNLDADGIVGQRSFEAMNVPVGMRIGQIRVNLERTRWVYRDLDQRFIVVNIAGFHVALVEGREVVWSSRVQVGKTYRKTPVFKAAMTYLVFNPTWTVPPTILAKDVLPAIRKDRGHLKRKNMVVLDRSGKIVSPDSIDWANAKPGNFPYAIRQEPGPGNALGEIKFIFPNEHFVFLHDTPSKGLFDRAERTFSSGCIRVEHPFELAALLLADQPDWTEKRIAEAREGHKPRTIHLAEPMQVLLLYWTAMLGADGVVQFTPDIYERDAAVLDALNGDFVFKAPRGAADQLQ